MYAGYYHNYAEQRQITAGAASRTNDWQRAFFHPSYVTDSFYSRPMRTASWFLAHSFFPSTCGLMCFVCLDPVASPAAHRELSQT